MIESFLLNLAARVFMKAKEDKMYDMKGQQLVQTNYDKGVVLSLKNDDGNCIAIKIMVGTEEEVKEAFKS